MLAIQSSRRCSEQILARQGEVKGKRAKLRKESKGFFIIIDGMVWYGMVWYGMVWYGMVWYGMVWLLQQMCIFLTFALVNIGHV